MQFPKTVTSLDFYLRHVSDSTAMTDVCCDAMPVTADAMQQHYTFKTRGTIRLNIYEYIYHHLRGRLSSIYDFAPATF